MLHHTDICQPNPKSQPLIFQGFCLAKWWHLTTNNALGELFYPRLLQRFWNALCYSRLPGTARLGVRSLNRASASQATDQNCFSEAPVVGVTWGAGVSAGTGWTLLGVHRNGSRHHWSFKRCMELWCPSSCTSHRACTPPQVKRNLSTGHWKWTESWVVQLTDPGKPRRAILVLWGKPSDTDMIGKHCLKSIPFWKIGIQIQNISCQC